MITDSDIRLLAPEGVLAAGALIAMLSAVLKRTALFSWLVTLAALAVSLGLLFGAGSGAVGQMCRVDGPAKCFSGLLIAAALVVALVSRPYFRHREAGGGEYDALLLLATLGAVVMTVSASFVAFFLSLELLTVALYGLVATLKEDGLAIEAGVKYLVLASVSSAFLLFGVALLYFQTGRLDLGGIGAAGPGNRLVFDGGLALVFVGIGFKMALVPFHMWTPDIYSGAPAPVSAFVATVSKGAVFAFLTRLFTVLGGAHDPRIFLIFALLAGASMLIGNWLALRQHLLKRMLAYSSIAHLGYLLVAVLAGGAAGLAAGVFYLGVYFLSMLGAFGTVGYLSGPAGEPGSLEEYRGLFFSRPWLGAFLAVVMLSLAGIPLTAGFMGKLYIVSSGAATGRWALLAILIVSSTIGLFYYLRVVSLLFSAPGQEPRWERRAAFPTGIVLAVLFLLLIAVGVYPGPVMEIIRHLAAHG